MRLARRGRWAGLLVVVVTSALVLTSCQWLQNEFFFLDSARPPLPAELDPATFGER